MLSETKKRLWELYQAHEVRFEIGFFIAGFIFDILFISEVDDPFAILQQIAYLFLIGSCLHYEVLFDAKKWVPSSRIVRIWDYRNLILHFSLGSLLNLYSLFYIKSASLLNSLLFLVVMLAIILANELPIVKKSTVGLKAALFAICLFSFFSILFPLALGYVGWLPVGLSIASTSGIFYFQFRSLNRHLSDSKTASQLTIAPGGSVLILFGLFYFMGWIPPVPLSVVEQGIYHDVKKTNGIYFLSTENPWWKFWNSGDQYFQARTGDHVYYYAQIYSPARFSDEVFVHWSHRMTNGEWANSDRIPLKIAGGRKEGYRGYAVKANYQPGEWRIQIKTGHGQEIARIYFDVFSTDTSEPREFTVLER
jgi:hypothetical protein